MDDKDIHMPFLSIPDLLAGLFLASHSLPPLHDHI